mmetsp:Transcript_24738/g.43583  ORF Transcript_24738/g.43583 Transcript_24738/m.43583 type:complete len:146 (+) Transcript_24738:440-877(+)
MLKNNYFYDDRFTIYPMPPNWPNCQDYQNKIFISSDASLTFSNVSFLNFRQNIRSLIKASNHLTLIDVAFDNIKTGSIDKSAVITLECSELLTCKFSYEGGSVSRLNNGFELLQDTIQPGFIYASSYDIKIVGVDFSLSTVYKGL